MAKIEGILTYDDNHHYLPTQYTNRDHKGPKKETEQEDCHIPLDS
ncbi:MAG: hypothetical protein ACI8RD_004701 [Bacillariaceae sp.]|jgi:hypothetical protein